MNIATRFKSDFKMFCSVRFFIIITYYGTKVQVLCLLIFLFEKEYLCFDLLVDVPHPRSDSNKLWFERLEMH